MYPLFGGFDSLYHTFAVADTTHVGNLTCCDMDASDSNTQTTYSDLTCLWLPIYTGVV